jgi:type VI secretion system protein ImpK
MVPTDVNPALIHKNPLLAAANPLLTLISQFKLHPQEKRLTAFQEIFQKECAQTEQRLHGLGYDKDSVLISLYVLDTCVDTVLDQHLYKEAGRDFSSDSSKEKTSQTPFHFDNKRFFVVLEKICKAPQTFIDTIELVYVCLNLSIEETIRDYPYWIKLNDQIYQLIRSERDDLGKKLSPPIPQNKPTVVKSSSSMSRWIPLLEVAIISIFMFGFVLSVTHYLFSSYSSQFSKTLSVMTHSLNHSDK